MVRDHETIPKSLICMSSEFQKEKNQDSEKASEEIMDKNFQNLVKDINI